MWLSLQHAWVYQHFQGMGSNDAWAGYQEHQDPRAMLFVPLFGLGTPDNYRNHLDALDLTRVVMTPYGDHRQARLFERVSLYSGWLRYRDRMVRYLAERVLRQFGRVQTIPIHPVQSEPPDINLAEISNRFRRALDYALTPKQLGQRAVYDVEATEGYIKWFYQVSHPRMVLHDMPVPVSRPLEREVLDAQTAQEDGEAGYLQLSERMSRIRDHVYVVMSSGVVPRGSEEWQHLEDVLKEVHDGKVYSRRGATEGGRGGKGGGRGGGGTGVVIRG